MEHYDISVTVYRALRKAAKGVSEAVVFLYADSCRIHIDTMNKDERRLL